MTRIILLLIAVGLVGGVFALNAVRQEESGESILRVAEDDPLPVLLTTPTPQTVIRRVQAPGDVEAVLEVEIRSEIPAKIEEMPVKEGDMVKAGELLCRLNDDEFRAMVESSEASIAGLSAMIRFAEAESDKAKRDCDRQERLAQHEATSDLELADYRTTLVQSVATLEVRRQERAEAEAMLRRAQDNLKKTIITSPIDGIVSKIHAEPGEVVVTGTMNNPGTVIMVVTDMSRMQIRARVDETDVPLVQSGQLVDIFLPSDPQTPIPGTVDRVATSGSKAAGRDIVMFETIIAVESKREDVKPGMSTNVEIQVARRDNTVTVPVQAVVHRKRKDLPKSLVEAYEKEEAADDTTTRRRNAQFLKVIFSMEDGEATPHLVRTGIADETHVEILAGVPDDAEIIIGPYRSLDMLKKGTKVKLEEDEDDDEDDEDEEAKSPDDTKLADDSATSPDNTSSDESTQAAHGNADPKAEPHNVSDTETELAKRQ